MSNEEIKYMSNRAPAMRGFLTQVAREKGLKIKDENLMKDGAFYTIFNKGVIPEDYNKNPKKYQKHPEKYADGIITLEEFKAIKPEDYKTKVRHVAKAYGMPSEEETFLPEYDAWIKAFEANPDGLNEDDVQKVIENNEASKKAKQ